MCIAERQARRHRPRAEHGISLIELIVFIVIVGIAVAGVVGALSMATRASADPMIQKQARAIPATDSVLITVTVLGPTGTNTTVLLDGYRVRYAPNAVY